MAYDLKTIVEERNRLDGEKFKLHLFLGMEESQSLNTRQRNLLRIYLSNIDTSIITLSTLISEMNIGNYC